MTRCTTPSCSDCAFPLSIVEPFVGGVAQYHRCGGCGVHLRVRRIAVDAWTVTTAAEFAGQRTTPLPAVASAARRGRFLAACGRVARLLQPCEGVEPGMAVLTEAASHE